MWRVGRMLSPESKSVLLTQQGSWEVFLSSREPHIQSAFHFEVRQGCPQRYGDPCPVSEGACLHLVQLSTRVFTFSMRQCWERDIGINRALSLTFIRVSPLEPSLPSNRHKGSRRQLCLARKQDHTIAVVTTNHWS